MATGFVLHELSTEAPALEPWFRAMPEWVASAVPVSFSWVYAVWFLVAVPVALWTVALGGFRLLGHRAGLGPSLRALATGALPVVAIAHAAKAIAKLGSWGPWLPLSLGDPRGTTHFAQLVDGTLVTPDRLYPAALVALPTLLLAVLAAWAWHRRLSGGGERAGLVVPGVVLGAFLAAWLI